MYLSIKVNERLSETPYKRWLADCRKGFEEFAQTIIDNARAVQDVFSAKNKTLEKELKQAGYCPSGFKFRTEPE